MGHAVAPVTLVSANVGPNQALPANGRIELGFDRLLQPTSITRQTFVLENAGGSIAYMPTVAYDPVARIVTITPLTDKSQVLVPGQSYDVIVLGPQSAADVNGLRAIDGATPRQRVTRIAFSVTDASPEPPQTVSIDFCRDIHPIITSQCGLSVCHGATLMGPAAGLVLDPPSGIPTTAIGRVAQGSNTGPLSAASAPTLLFGEDMPIIDATGVGGNAANSWLMYKVLLGMPEPEPVDASTGAGAGAGAGADASADVGAAADGAASGGDASADAGAGDASGEAGTASRPLPPPPVDVSGVYALGWQGISAAERATLSNYILGREMPFPLGEQNDPLTLDQMERLSLWIAQGAKVPAATCPQ